jgi:hypothetical protein
MGMLMMLAAQPPDAGWPAGMGAAAALIVAVVAVVRVWLAQKRARVADERRRVADEQKRAADEQLRAALIELHAKFSQQLKSAYGLSAQESIAEVEIRDDGSAKVTKSWRGISVGSNVTVGSIPGKTVAVVEGGQPNSKPLLIPPSSGFGKAIHLEKIKVERGTCFYQVVITGGLTHSDIPLDYGVSGDISKGFLMTREEVEACLPADFPYEYAGTSLDFPAEKLVLRVRFSQTFRAATYPFVFLGFEGEIAYPNPEELLRVRAGFKELAEAGGAELVVNTPLVGVLYAIYWTPPFAKK